MSKGVSEKLLDILNNDPLGLLTVEDKSTHNLTTEEQRLIEGFAEISDFFEEYGREPSGTGDIGDFTLKARLNAIRVSPDKVRVLLPYDFYKLLQGQNTKSVSIEDILDDDPLNIFNDEEIDNSIFKLSNVKKSERLRPDHISRRTICKNFSEYENLFNEIHQDIKDRRRKLIEFSSKDIVAGRFFILGGVLLYLEKDKSEITEQEFESGSRLRKDGRTRCIFDNGTESEMLLRSLDKAMQIDGFSVSDVLDASILIATVDENDVQNGYIYVLRSLCTDAQVSSIDNLYKIGYSSGDVTNRIKNACNEPTYLMSDVQVVITVRCFNMNVKNLESNIHRFFSEVNVATQINDRTGKQRFPREWFSAPLPVIEETIRLIVNDKIQSYRYDKALQTVVLRKSIN